MNQSLPDPLDLAARKALAAMHPRASLESTSPFEIPPRVIVTSISIDDC